MIQTEELSHSSHLLLHTLYYRMEYTDNKRLVVEVSAGAYMGSESLDY